MSAQTSVPHFAEFPSQPEDLTTDWLTAVLRANGVAADVVAFDCRRIGTGLIGQNVRIRLQLAPGAPSDAPATLVAKFVSPDPTSRGTGIAMGNYERERDFYRDMAPLLRAHGMRLARCWAAEFDPQLEATVLMLEDLAPAEQGDQVGGAGVADIEAAVRQAAVLHATFWQSPRLSDHAWLRDPGDAERAVGTKALVEMMWPPFLDRYRDRITPEAQALAERFVPVVDRWILERTGPFTITHGDYRIDNLLFAGEGERWAVAVDWQTPNIGMGGLDIGYLVGAGLLPGDRRAHERNLVRLWHDELTRHGVTGYTMAQAWDDYRQGQFSGIVMAIVASMITERTERGDEMFWAMGGRHLQAALDLDAADLLPS